MIPENTGAEEWGSEEQAWQLVKVALLSKSPLWATRASSHWGALGPHVEHASELSQPRGKKVGVLIQPAYLLSLAEGCWAGGRITLQHFPLALYSTARMKPSGRAAGASKEHPLGRGECQGGVGGAPKVWRTLQI